VLGRYVVQQHQSMSYEKTAKGDRCLLQLDNGKITTRPNEVFEKIGMGNGILPGRPIAPSTLPHSRSSYHITGIPQEKLSRSSAASRPQAGIPAILLATAAAGDRSRTTTGPEWDGGWKAGGNSPRARHGARDVKLCGIASLDPFVAQPKWEMSDQASRPIKVPAGGQRERGNPDRATRHDWP
jgi:hypothetical protein